MSSTSLKSLLKCHEFKGLEMPLKRASLKIHNQKLLNFNVPLF